MAQKQQKLELTWIGKGEEPTLEPRILIENPEYSYGDSDSENMLIHGDNLLALKALEQDYTGKVKCIYIDPPYNTGARIDADGKDVGYEDGYEHSTWLNLMKPRLVILRKLLSDDGTIIVSIDNNELAYLMVVMDEIFLRSNRKNIVSIKRGSVTGAKVINPGLVNISEFILIYSKNYKKWSPNRLYSSKDRDSRYGTVIKNIEDHYSDWEFETLLESFSRHVSIKKSQLKKHFGEKYEEVITEYALSNAERVIRLASLDENSISKSAVELKEKSLKEKNKTFFMQREGKRPYYVLNGNLILFVKDRLQDIDGELKFSEPLTDIWLDTLPNDLHNEGGVKFRKGKKPEKLISRLIRLSTQEGDWVLDSFLGSGTTAGVALKAKRKFIGIEFGDHAYSHCIPRLKNTIDNKDSAGVTNALNWQGGGGFKFYELAPSLLNKDQYDNWVISKEYNANMLAAAMAKQEGFSYSPNTENYWKQGFSSEQDFIYTTTQFVTVELLDQLHDQLQEGDSLLICAKKFQPECANRFSKISLKKIPQMLLGKCEFAKDDYSLNIINLPQEDDINETEEDLENE